MARNQADVPAGVNRLSSLARNASKTARTAAYHRLATLDARGFSALRSQAGHAPDAEQQRTLLTSMLHERDGQARVAAQRLLARWVMTAGQDAALRPEGAEGDSETPPMRFVLAADAAATDDPDYEMLQALKGVTLMLYSLDISCSPGELGPVVCSMVNVV
jgi:hypothetical protein